MSFDIYLEKTCKECKHEAQYFSYNITHNTNEIVERCFGPELVGKDEIAPDLLAREDLRRPDGHPYDGYNRRAWGRLEGHTAPRTVKRPARRPDPEPWLCCRCHAPFEKLKHAIAHEALCTKTTYPPPRELKVEVDNCTEHLLDVQCFWNQAAGQVEVTIKEQQR